MSQKVSDGASEVAETVSGRALETLLDRPFDEVSSRLSERPSDRPIDIPSDKLFETYTQQEALNPSPSPELQLSHRPLGQLPYESTSSGVSYAPPSRPADITLIVKREGAQLSLVRVKSLMVVDSDTVEDDPIERISLAKLRREFRGDSAVVYDEDEEVITNDSYFTGPVASDAIFEGIIQWFCSESKTWARLFMKPKTLSPLLNPNTPSSSFNYEWPSAVRRSLTRYSSISNWDKRPEREPQRTQSENSAQFDVKFSKISKNNLWECEEPLRNTFVPAPSLKRARGASSNLACKSEQGYTPRIVESDEE